MNLGSYLRRSIKTRVTLFTLAIFVISIWSLAFYASRMLREDMQRLLGEQQFSTASIVAAQINDELVSRLTGLESVAKTITPEILGNPTILQSVLEGQVTFLSMFNNGVAVTDPDGTVISDAPLLAGRIGANFMDRDYIIGALREGKATIGRPVTGKASKAPVFVMAVPIRSAQGGVIGALAGVTDLGRPNFLDTITEGRYGNTGGYILIAAKHRLVVTASDKNRIMQSLAAPGIVPQTDRFIQGFEGYAVYVNPRGEEVLNASKRIPVAGWNMAVTVPTAEAFAPIRAMQQRMLLATILLTLLAGGLTWWMLRRQLSPMLAAVKALSARSDTNQHPQPLAVASQDEIGNLIVGFNHLLETLANREQALKESEFRWKFAIEGSGDGLWDWNVAEGTVFFSRTWKAMLGYSESEIGQGLEEWEKRLHPEDKASTLATLKNALDGNSPIYVSEHRVCCKDGSYLWILDRGMVVSRSEDGKPLRMIGTHKDITERKQMQDQVRQLAFQDALTNLPNRRLLSDRLSQTMAASRRSGCYGALMFVDLDNFKLLNDTHGHAIGDLLLIEAADRLRSSVREMDTVARFGGDEFVVMISELSLDASESAAQASIIAEKIRTALAKPYVFKTRPEGKPETIVEHRCTASIGVALFGQHDASLDSILMRADIAMYRAKEAGCDLIRFYDANAREAA